VQKGERLLPRSRRAEAGQEAGRESGKNQSGFSRRDFRRRLKDKKAPYEAGPEAEQHDAAFLTVSAFFPVALTVAGLAFFTAAFFGVTALGFLGAKTFSASVSQPLSVELGCVSLSKQTKVLLGWVFPFVAVRVSGHSVSVSRSRASARLSA
jgi:hypothetical protein